MQKGSAFIGRVLDAMKKPTGHKVLPLCGEKVPFYTLACWSLQSPCLDHCVESTLSRQGTGRSLSMLLLVLSSEL